MKARSWLILSSLLGLSSGLMLHLLASGALKRDAVLIGVSLALFSLGLPALSLRPRHPSRLSKGARRTLLLLFSALSLSALLHLLYEAQRGYPLLRPIDLLQEEVPSGFATVEGRPLLEALYIIRGREGERALLPLAPYEGRLLVILPEPPEGVALRITGRLRERVQSVQRSVGGEMEGPFLPLYREHVGLSPGARVLFLDSEDRAGLNAPTLGLLMVPLYLLLLIWGMKPQD